MPPASARLERSTVVALVAMAMAVFVIANDVTALSVALPAIESDFDADVGTAQWVISAYALIFGVLIVPGGRLADLFGRRRIFFVGAAIFALFSLLGGLAPDAWALIACRALMGVGGALMWPATLGMTYSILPSGAGGAGRRADHRRRRLRQRRRPADRRLPHRLAQLALGPLPQPPDRRPGVPGNLARRARVARGRGRAEARLRRRGDALARPDRPAGGARRGRRLRLDVAVDPRPVGPLRRAPGRVRAQRAPRRQQGARAAGRDVQPPVRSRVPGGPAHVPHVLRLARVPPSIHAENPGLLTGRGGPGPAADDGGLRARLLCRRTALRTPRAAAGSRGRRGVPRCRAGADRARRDGRQLGTDSSRGWWCSAPASGSSTARSRRKR